MIDSTELLSPFPSSQVTTIREHVLADTLAFAREVCGFRLDDQTGLPSLVDDVHGPLCEFLNRPGKRKLIIMSRDSYKTSVVTVAWPLQQIARNPNHCLLIDSAVRLQAKKWAGLVRWHLEYNPRFLQLFGTLRRDPGWTDDFFTVRRTHEVAAPTVMTSGIDQSVVGLHFPLTIGDDLVTEENSQTKEQRDKVMTHIRRLRPIVGAGDLALVGTRWDDDDAYGRILRAESGGRKMSDIMDQLRAEGTAQIGRYLVFFRDCYGVDGKAGYARRGWGLVPKFTPEYLDGAKEDMGEYEFSANYLGDPVPQASAAFKKEHVERWWTPPLPDGLQVTMVTDPAVSEQPRAAYSALTAVAYDPSTRYRYVLVAWHDKVGETELVKKICDIYEALAGDGLHIYGVAMEETALQRVYLSLLRVEEERRRLVLPIRSLRVEEQRKAKHLRIQGLMPLFEQGLVFLQPEQTDLIEELARYPRAAHRDLLDSLAYHLDLQRNLSRLVYPMWEPERHILPADKLPRRFQKVAACLHRPTIAEDFGLLVMGKDGKTWYALEEAIIPRGSSNSDVLAALNSARVQYRIPAARIYLPPWETQLRLELVRMKFVLRLTRAYQDPAALASRLATMLERERILVGSHLEELIREFSLYSWPDKPSALTRRPDPRYGKLIGAMQHLIWQEEPPERQYWPKPKDPYDETRPESPPPARGGPTGYGYTGRR